MEKKTLTKEQIEKIVAGTSVSYDVLFNFLKGHHYSDDAFAQEGRALLAEAKNQGCTLTIKEADLIVARLAEFDKAK